MQTSLVRLVLHSNQVFFICYTGSTTVDSNQVRQQWILHQHAYPDSHIHSLVFVIEDLLFLHLGGYVFPDLVARTSK